MNRNLPSHVIHGKIIGGNGIQIQSAGGEPGLDGKVTQPVKVKNNPSISFLNHKTIPQKYGK
jgi:hypothetical protein